MMNDDLIELTRARQLSSSGAGRRIRLAAGLSVRELATAIGMEPTTLWRWERAKSRPRGVAARRWQALLRELQAEVDPQAAAEPWGER